MSTEIAQQLAEFTVATKLENIPEKAIEFGKGLILKTIAGMLAGSTTPAGKKVANLVKGRNQPPEVGVTGCGFKTVLADATFANAFFAHASELEDDRFDYRRGGGAWDITVLPVTFALAEKGMLSGEKLLEASIIGLEVHCRTCLFPTIQIGLGMIPASVGPAVAAAKAMGLGINETASAMGLSMAGVHLSTLNSGTDAHYFESALQALNGLLAAEMAGLGMTSNPDMGKYLSLILGKDKVRPEEMVEDLGSNWIFQDIWIKKYPSCFGTHREIDALLDLIKGHNLSYDQIERVEAHISRTNKILDRPEPKTINDLQFSLQHTLGNIMISKDVNFDYLTVENINNTKLKEASDKVKVIVHDDWPRGLMEACALVVVKTKDGREFSRKRMAPTGSREEPLSMQQFRELYHKFTQGILPEEQIKATADDIMNLETLNDVTALMNAVTFNSLSE